MRSHLFFLRTLTFEKVVRSMASRHITGVLLNNILFTLTILQEKIIYPIMTRGIGENSDLLVENYTFQE